MYLQYVQAALHCTDAEYLQALDGFRRQFPGDPALIVQAIDHFRLTHQYEGAVRAAAVFEQSIGGDPCLKALRGLLLAKGWRFVEARAAATQAIEEEPTLKLAYFARIHISLAEANHPDTLEWLKKLVEATGHKVRNLQTDSDYAVFVRSPQYREWLSWTANHNGS
jgi:hypothetical protein